jgi:hypothetical protein
MKDSLPTPRTSFSPLKKVRGIEPDLFFLGEEGEKDMWRVERESLVIYQLNHIQKSQLNVIHQFNHITMEKI